MHFGDYIVGIVDHHCFNFPFLIAHIKQVSDLIIILKDDKSLFSPQKDNFFIFLKYVINKHLIQELHGLDYLYSNMSQIFYF